MKSCENEVVHEDLTMRERGKEGERSGRGREKVKKEREGERERGEGRGGVREKKRLIRV
jgi:hypothetical protein